MTAQPFDLEEFTAVISGPLEDRLARAGQLVHEQAPELPEPLPAQPAPKPRRKRA